MEKCSQCLNLFTLQNPPFMMPGCQHSICKSCVSQVIIQRGFLECAFCGIQKNIDGKTVVSKTSLFKRNQKLINKIKKQKLIKCRSATNLLSNDLLNNQTNEESFLNISWQLQQQTSSKEVKQDKKASQNPQYQKISDQESKNINYGRQFCQLHQRERNIVCLTDKVRVCQFCAIFGSHKDHQFLSLHQFDAQFSRNALRFQTVRPLKQNIQDFLTQNGFQNYFDEAVTAKRKDNQFKIKIHFLKIQQDLNKLQIQALRKLNESYIHIKRQMFKDYERLALNYQQTRNVVQNLQKNYSVSKKTKTLHESIDYILSHNMAKDCLNFWGQEQQKIIFIDRQKTRLLQRTLKKSQQVQIYLKEGPKIALQDILEIVSTQQIQPYIKNGQLKCVVDQQSFCLLPYKQFAQPSVQPFNQKSRVVKNIQISSQDTKLQQNKYFFQETNNLFNIKSGKGEIESAIKLKDKKSALSKQLRLQRSKSDTNLQKGEIDIQKQKQNQRVVTGSKVTEKEVEMSFSRLSDQQIIYKVASLQFKPISINLAHNFLTEQGLKQILDKLTQCRKIDLSDNKLQKGSLEYILKKISEFRKLKVLIMTSNQISFKNSQVFKQQFRKKGINLIV